MLASTTSPPPISFGRDRIVPSALDMPDKSATIASAAIFPTASSPRRIGVMRIVVIVPRSYSHAIDSGATAIQPEKRKIMRSSGSIEANNEDAVSSLVARS